MDCPFGNSATTYHQACHRYTERIKGRTETRVPEHRSEPPATYAEELAHITVTVEE